MVLKNKCRHTTFKTYYIPKVKQKCDFLREIIKWLNSSPRIIYGESTETRGKYESEGLKKKKPVANSKGMDKMKKTF